MGQWNVNSPLSGGHYTKGVVDGVECAHRKEGTGYHHSRCAHGRGLKPIPQASEGMQIMRATWPLQDVHVMPRSQIILLL